MSSNLSNKLKAWREHCLNIQNSNPVDLHESQASKASRVARAKKDYNYFVNAYFKHYADTDCADFQLDAAKKIKADPNIFAVLEWPREHAKSVHADVLIPLWLKINGELTGLVQVGKNWDDAAGLLADLQAELEFNPLFINDFGAQKTDGSWQTGEFVDSDGIEYIAIGRGQSPRGIRNRQKRPNYCSIDDIDDDELVENPDRVGKVVRWILGSLYGALAIKGSRLVVVGNRIHRKGVLAHIVGDTDPEQPKRKGIYHSKISAIMNGRPAWNRYTLQELQLKFERMGYYLSQREFFHNPIVEGKVFKREWIRWGILPKLEQFDMIVAYFDPSYKAKTSNDFKAVRVWGAAGHLRYLIACFVRQATITDAVKWMYDFHERTRDRVSVNFYMEEVFLQDMFYDDFEAEAKLRGYYLPVAGDTRHKPEKFMRIQATAPYYERGIIIYNEAERKNADMQTGLDQVLGFEKGSSVHDDAPDADEGALFLLQKYGRQTSSKPVIGKNKHKNLW